MPPPYTFYLHDGVHAVPAFELRACADDDDACAQALDVLQHFQEYDTVEIWKARSELFTVSRPNRRVPRSMDGERKAMA